MMQKTLSPNQSYSKSRTKSKETICKISFIFIFSNKETLMDTDEMNNADFNDLLIVYLYVCMQTILYLNLHDMF